jgi:ribonuclease D
VPYVTLDTEFLRDQTYYPRLCLIQMAAPKAGAEAIIDPLAHGLDLAPFYDFIKNPAIIKVLHAARQDIEIFFLQGGVIPHPLFDTQIAAMVAGFGDQVAYDALVGALTGGHIDKAHRFSDWSARPLSKAQIEYAAADVTWLRLVYERLRARLESDGRLDWVSEEMAALTDPALYRADPESAWERLRARSGNRRYLAVLKALAAWREREAQRVNIPRQRVVKDEALMEIAATMPETPEALARARGLNRSFAEGRMGAAMLDAIAAAKAIPEDALPDAPAPRDARPSPALVALLKVLLAAKAEEHHVAAKLLASSDELDRIALGERDDIPALHGWRRDVFGAAALALCEGQLALGVQGRRVRLIELSDHAYEK